MSAEVIEELKTAIEVGLPGCRCRVAGGGGHFEVEVTSALFEGKGKLQRQRLVYTAIADLMAGSRAPVHAIDKMITETP